LLRAEFVFVVLGVVGFCFCFFLFSVFFFFFFVFVFGIIMEYKFLDYFALDRNLR